MTRPILGNGRNLCSELNLWLMYDVNVRLDYVMVCPKLWQDVLIADLCPFHLGARLLGFCFALC